jgi:hypothetical protein
MLLSTDQIDRLLCLLASWDRETLSWQIGRYASRFPLDLTPEFLRDQPVEHIRHVFFAVCVQNRRLPEAAHAGEELAMVA